METPAPPPAPAPRPRRGLVLAIKILSAVLSFAVLVASGAAWALYRDFTVSVATGADIPEVEGTDAVPDIDGVDQNILLVGNDSRVGASAAELADIGTEDDGGGTNTDTMIVLHVPADGSKATLISFPRDSYVDIPGNGQGRLNSAYGIAYNAAKARGASETAAESAGLLLTARTISALTGLRIDHYLQIKMIGFYRISKAINGVDVCLNNAMGPSTEYGAEGAGLDAGFEPDGTYVYSYSGIDLKKGVNHIEGKQAIAFVRQRHGLLDGDLDRVARQRYFLGAVFREVSSAGILLNPFRMQALLSAVSSSLLKDKSLDLLQLATQLRGLASGNIIGATMVTTGPTITDDGADVLGVDPAAVKAQMKALVVPPATATPSATPTTASPSTPSAPASSVSVQVLNGSGVNGAAAAAAATLQGLGMTVVGTGDADSTGVTTVRYPPGAQAQAQTVAATLPGATVTEDPGIADVTLVLGSDGLAPGGSAAASTTSAPSVPPSATGAPAVDNARGGLACIN